MLELGKNFYRAVTTVINQPGGDSLDLDYKYGITKTGIKYFGDDVLSTVIDREGSQLFMGPFLQGYTASINHNLNVNRYVHIKLQKTAADVNDPFGGEFQNFQSLFGYDDIRRLRNNIQLKVALNDGVIELTQNYRFHIWFTQNNDDE